ncbi:MAG: nuclear transport factor 2 family protein [Vicingaceae bacterium]
MKFQEENWNRGDIAAYMEGYWKSDSLLFVGSKGPTYGWMQTFKNYLKAYPNQEAMGKLRFNLVKVDLLSDKNAFVVGRWQLDRKADTLKGYFSLLWQKINGEWKIIVDHSSAE